MTVVFNKPYVPDTAITNISAVLKSGHHAGGGEFTKKCENFFEARLGCPKVILTSSCTDALEMASLVIDVEPNDEIIVPSYTFVSSANAFVLHGARICFVDVEPESLNFDLGKIETAINHKTKAIVAVNYGGQSGEMYALRKICDDHGIYLIEDAAQSIEAKFKGKYLGTFGHLSTFSFHETKNISCGEGGALVVNDPNFVQKANFIRDKGTNRSSFLDKHVKKYTWVSKGSSFLMSEFTAAILWSQLQEIEQITTRRKSIWEHYANYFHDNEKTHRIVTPMGHNSKNQINGHLFFLKVKTHTKRQTTIEALAKNGIMSVSHYEPLHLSSAGQKYGYSTTPLEITESISPTILRLPIWSGKFPQDQVMTALDNTFNELSRELT